VPLHHRLNSYLHGIDRKRSLLLPSSAPAAAARTGSHYISSFFHSNTQMKAIRTLFDYPTAIYNQHVPRDEIGFIRSKVDRGCCDILRATNTSPRSHSDNLLA